MSHAQKVAVLGLGIMGAAMAKNLHAAGLAVRVWNRTPSAATELVELGLPAPSTPAAAAQDADVVLTMVSDGAAVEAVMFGDDGALAAMKPGALWIQMATIGVPATEHLIARARAAGIDFVDAPVLGTRQPAEQGTLTVLASGPVALKQRCAPVFEAVGERTVWVGDAGASSRLKLVANQWSTGMVALLAETVTLARSLDVAPESFFELVQGSPFSAPYAQSKGTHMIERRFPPSFPLDMAHKDVRLALDVARQHGCTLPVTTAIERQYDRAEAEGRGRDDLSAVIAAL
ncbi:NAD(P)-dependent oxidoreductase [Haliangium sp.]|uniref:NAD(P)-dependent oxidoreductase n=1 Tax=Haliangium sp. TaxID=2663208 RepID=UPI003D0A5168